jgi:hypothetical protein
MSIDVSAMRQDAAGDGQPGWCRHDFVLRPEFYSSNTLSCRQNWQETLENPLLDRFGQFCRYLKAPFPSST